MTEILVLGAGKIGRMVVHLLANCGDYEVRVADQSPQAIDRICHKYSSVTGSPVDFEDTASLEAVLGGAAAVISCAPFGCNPAIAEAAIKNRVHYLDLTEDTAVTRTVQDLAGGAETAVVPQCGLAPGFITIVANHLIADMSDVTDLRLRVGALPRYPSNRLKFNLTWSTEGLINEYCNPCEVVLNGELRNVQPLENLERLTIDGVEYEAFNTSGGLGTLADTLHGKVRNVNYKSIRYPGHNHLIKFLLKDLKMQDHLQELELTFDRCLPTTFRDQIVIFVSATGQYRSRLTDNVYARTIYHREMDGENWSGIQITTAAGVCGVLDLLISGELPQKGLLRMEQVSYTKFIQNRFGSYYA